MKDSRVPSEELVDKVRAIAAYQLGFSSQMAKSLGEKGLLRTYLGEQLRSLLSQSDIQISIKESLGIRLGKNGKVVHKVAEKGTVQLEFTYAIYRTGESVSRTLESVSRYQPGDWEHKVDMAYQKCIVDLRSQWEQVNSFVKQLSTVPHTPDEVVKLIEATGDPAQTIKLLALSSNRETMCEPLIGVYFFVGKIKEAQLVIETRVSLYPEEARYHLALGNVFFGALYNCDKPPIDPLPLFRQMIDTTGQAGEELLRTLKGVHSSLYRSLTDKEYKLPMDDTWVDRVTLEALGCSYDFARKRADEQFMEAMRLSRDKWVKEQAREALVTLRMMDKAKRSGESTLKPGNYSTKNSVHK